MASLNRVLLIGNLTRDPELRYAGGSQGGGGGGQGGSAICKFGLAVNREWRDQSGQQHEEATFVDIVVFGRQGETCNEYLRKGRAAFIEGRLHLNQWEDRESGQKRSKLEVVAERVQFLGGPSRDGGEGGGYRDRARSDSGGAPAAAPSAPPAAAGGPPPRAPRPAAGGGGGGGGGGDGVDFDDIPF